MPNYELFYKLVTEEGLSPDAAKNIMALMEIPLMDIVVKYMLDRFISTPYMLKVMIEHVASRKDASEMFLNGIFKVHPDLNGKRDKPADVKDIDSVISKLKPDDAKKTFESLKRYHPGVIDEPRRKVLDEAEIIVVNNYHLSPTEIQKQYPGVRISEIERIKKKIEKHISISVGSMTAEIGRCRAIMIYGDCTAKEVYPETRLSKHIGCVPFEYYMVKQMIVEPDLIMNNLPERSSVVPGPRSRIEDRVIVGLRIKFKNLDAAYKEYIRIYNRGQHEFKKIYLETEIPQGYFVKSGSSDILKTEMMDKIALERER